MKTFADLYRLKKDDLTALDRMGEKTPRTCSTASRPARHGRCGGSSPLWASGTWADNRPKSWRSISARSTPLMNAGQDQLEAIDQVGPVMAESVYQYFRHPRHRMVIDDLLAAGVRPQPPAPKKADGRFPGQDRRRDGNTQGLLAPAGRAGDPGGRRQGLGQRQQEDRITFWPARTPAASCRRPGSFGVEVIDEEQFNQILAGKEVMP